MEMNVKKVNNDIISSEEVKTHYKFRDIAMMRCDFSRNNTTRGENIDAEFNYNSTVFEEESLIQIILQMKLVRSDFEMDVVLVGQFEYSENPVVPIDVFKKLNGVSMMFPYMRQYVTTLSVLGGLKPLLLPPINFEKMVYKPKHEIYNEKDIEI